MVKRLLVVGDGPLDDELITSTTAPRYLSAGRDCDGPGKCNTADGAVAVDMWS